ncbi:hypothetical protein QR680_002206 [Steinernema hermaphroditum]|uniref:GTP-binding protein Rhes n=1 Tax=Steinernema hermaphroditum TaxID=289476 RepID=A0AA39H3X8_9BILA|nr:hypothetical protein QR680_002206 [Steinernema hermaphroditum]
MSLLNRRSVRNPRLVRLPSRAGESTSFQDGSSCPNSPAIKKTFRLIVIGSARTGKTSIVNRFLEKDFEDRYLPTIENFHRKIYKIRGELYQLDILDCSGNDPFPASRKLSYISGDMFIVVSSVDLPQSVEQMIDIRQQIIECKSSRVGFNANTPQHVPILFVMNKTDLPKSRWQTDPEEAASLIEEAISGNARDIFLTCSAAGNENIETVFGKMFALAKLPRHMNPQLHKMLRNELSADGVLNTSEGGKKRVLQRMRSRFSRDFDDTTFTDINARRPSLRTDLLMNRAKTSVIQLNCNGNGICPHDHQSRKCVIM